MIVPSYWFKINGNLKKEQPQPIVLTITEILRNQGVVGKFVEFYGDGLKELSIPDRATISNMAQKVWCNLWLLSY